MTPERMAAIKARLEDSSSSEEFGVDEMWELFHAIEALESDKLMLRGVIVLSEERYFERMAELTKARPIVEAAKAWRATEVAFIAAIGECAGCIGCDVGVCDEHDPLSDAAQAKLAALEAAIDATNDPTEP